MAVFVDLEVAIGTLNPVTISQTASRNLSYATDGKVCVGEPPTKTQTPFEKGFGRQPFAQGYLGTQTKNNGCCTVHSRLQQ
jgi:hypothetical protein